MLLRRVQKKRLQGEISYIDKDPFNFVSFLENDIISGTQTGTNNARLTTTEVLPRASFIRADDKVYQVNNITGDSLVGFREYLLREIDGEPEGA